jgi:hypothetical protein
MISHGFFTLGAYVIIFCHFLCTHTISAVVTGCIDLDIFCNVHILDVLTFLHFGMNPFVIHVLRHLHKCCSVHRSMTTLLRYIYQFSIKVVSFIYLGEKCLFLYFKYLPSPDYQDCAGSYRLKLPDSTNNLSHIDPLRL